MFYVVSRGIETVDDRNFAAKKKEKQRQEGDKHMVNVHQKLY